MVIGPPCPFLGRRRCPKCPISNGLLPQPSRLRLSPARHESGVAGVVPRRAARRSVVGASEPAGGTAAAKEGRAPALPMCAGCAAPS
eukprot:3888330-Alexandrium_andersonii.AAC.1